MTCAVGEVLVEHPFPGRSVYGRGVGDHAVEVEDDRVQVIHRVERVVLADHAETLVAPARPPSPPSLRSLSC